MAAEGLPEDFDEQDLYYVPEGTFNAMKEKLKDGKQPSEEDMKPLLEKILDPMALDDEEMMLPVDMRGVGKNFEGIEELIEELGAKGTAEAFIKAREYFEANKDQEPEEERPKAMKAVEWKQAILDDELGAMEEGEEEELLEEDPEEEDEEDEEPAAKKQKTA
eukprot:TRINITY_DN3471_c1_g1_i1.p2 TRINITY_DN3471_c1_g1~~TRINITY_DN3471_c1_g1_i1.p2  ORF type:complete len:163 (+),score=83.25 TRINITY_DN3471_c1_g1_i1:88-576(+)